MDNKSFTDEELTAYLDGEADPALTSSIEAVQDDQDVSRRLVALKLDMSAVKAAGALALRDAPALPDLPERSPNMKQSNAASWMVAAAVGAVIGVGLTFLARPPIEQDWVAQVASYQALYVADTLTLAPQLRTVADSVIATFEEVTGLDMSQATRLDDASFARAQMLGLDEAPLLQMVFALADGTPVALCVMPLSDSDAAIVTNVAEGLALARWNADGFGFVVIGGNDTENVRRLAAQARKQLAL